MDFLNKLYESNYFGIGLFAVISFLVVTFLIVLFFGKRDEKKRKLEEINGNLNINEGEIAFKETSVETPIEMPVAPIPIEEVPVMPINEEPTLTPVEPVAPINFGEVKAEAPVQVLDKLTFDEYQPIEPVKEIITEPVAPVIEPINVEPVKIEPINFEIPTEPKVLEPVKIDIPNEPINIEPIIKEEVPTIAPIIEEPIKIVEEPVINDTYYKPIEKEEPEEVSVPNIDFDAIAKSISKELDELEKSTNKSEYEEVKVTPINEVTSRPATQFSSVYVNKPATPIANDTIDLPKKIELPTMKNSEIEPENYTL